MCNTFYIWICINHCFSFAYLQFPFKKLLRSSAANTYITCCTFCSLALIYYSPTVIVLTFHAAFTQPNCPAKYFPLLTFNSRNLLPLCLSRSVGSVAVLFAELKWNKSRILLRNALQFTRYHFVTRGKLTNIRNMSALLTKSWWEENRIVLLIKYYLRRSFVIRPKGPCKRSQHCWPTRRNIVEPNMLRAFAHHVVCCCDLLEIVGWSLKLNAGAFSGANVIVDFCNSKSFYSFLRL